VSFEARRGPYRVTTDPAAFDLDVVHRFLAASSYWAEGVPRETVARSISNSLCFGVFEWEAQVGFARVVTDRATFAYLADVFVLESHRGRGLSKWLMECVRAHPELQGLRRWMLATRDAHSLYARFGFAPLGDPSRIMEILDRDVYKQEETADALRDAGHPLRSGA
jgi:GNAT superfamily N-acetyltransferase